MVKQHAVTGLKYFCKTTKKDPYLYKGSGVRWLSHLKVHGQEIETIWCELFHDKQTLVEYALRFSQENNIVESIQWANLVPEDGLAGWPPGAQHSSVSIEKCRINANGFKKGHSPHNRGKNNSPDHYAKQIAGQREYRNENLDWAAAWQEGKRKAETKRIATMKKLMTGSNNINYDPTIYVFENKNTLERVISTRNSFIKKYDCQPQNIYKLIKGTRKSVKGWTLVTI